MANFNFEEVTKKKFVIYGAQVVAYGAYQAIWGVYNKKPECFVVSSLEENPSEIDGIEVRLLDEIDRDMVVIVCVTELLQGEIINNLMKLGFHSYIKLTQNLECQLMRAYFQIIGKFFMAERTISKKEEVILYEVRNHRDKPLQYHPPLKEFEKSLQAGADLTDKRIAELSDNVGVNISEKNKQYCEMTGTYWVWKNTKSRWKGIEHYRRHLLISPEMLSEEIDAILPLPYMCYPNTLSQFRRFVSESVLQCLLKALKDLHPDSYKEYYQILNGKFQYTYNLVVAKEEVFDDYCGWFFNITEYIERMSDDVPEIKETRALSYVAEVLTNIYFMHNSKKLNIRHVEKAIYV